MARRVGVLAFFALIAFTTAAAALPPTVVGSWQGVVVNEDIPFESPAFFTFHIDRTMTASNRNPSTGDGHGAWKRSGPRSFSATFSSFLEAEDGPVTTIRTRLEITLDNDGDSWSAVVLFDVFVDGVLVDVASGTASAERLEVEPF